MPCSTSHAVCGLMQAPKSRSPSRRARSRNAPTLLSSPNTMPWKPSYGRASSAKRPDAACAADQSNWPLSTSSPPTTVPWPDRNLVAEWKMRSAPWSNGFISHGVVKVESTSSGRPLSWASAATVGMSSTSRPGLPSVSPNSSRVSGRIAARQPSMSPGFTKVVEMPKRDSV